MIKAILFDLDGTLLPMEQKIFAKAYFGGLMERVCPLGYTPDIFMQAMQAGIAAMVKNDGSRPNEAAFWEAFSAVSGNEILNHLDVFDAFYAQRFDDIRAVCGYNPHAAACVHELRASGLRVALATNPLFPAVATQKRIRWAGLEPEDFDLYTTYESIGTCKPNPDYYRTVAARMGVDPADCLMVGNDVSDDMPAASVGMKVFLLTDCLINAENVDISAYPNGSFDELMEYIATLRA
jgi:HAD superfamily hydrolase (TIGR01509 family)